jgi:Secretion system C-terminal sorting domain/Beta-propeller repeat
MQLNIQIQEYQWTKYVEDISCLAPKISVKSVNNVYLSSSLTGAFQFGSLTAQGPSSGFSDDIFITKMNSNGDFQWIKEVPGTGKAYVGNRNFLTSDNSGNVYFAGSTRGTTVWNQSITTTVTGFGDDALVLKYNSNGDLLMVKTASGSSNDQCNGIAVDNFGNIFVSGITFGASNFDAISHPDVDAPFIAKIGNLLSNAKNELNRKIIIYPNPSENQIFISNLESKTKGVIFNLFGQKVKNIEIENNTSISISDLNTGIYFIKFEGYQAEKMVKK